MTRAGAGVAYTICLRAGAVLGILAGGWLADAWTKRNPRGRILTQAIGLIAAGPFLFLSGATGSIQFLLAGLAVYGFGKGSYDCNNMPVLCQISRPCLRSTGFGIYNFASCLPLGTIAAVAGAVGMTPPPPRGALDPRRPLLSPLPFPSPPPPPPPTRIMF